MRPLDIKSLVEGILAIIFLALALGQFERLQKFAREEMASALESKNRLTNIFPKNYNVPNK